MKTGSLLLFGIFLAALCSICSAQEINVSVNVTSTCSANVNDSINITNNVTANGTCFNITANNVVFDCNGYTITGTGTGFGIYANARINLEIKNCIISNFSSDIYTANGSNGGWFHNNTLLNAAQDGVFVHASVSNNVSNNSFLANTNGIQLSNADLSMFGFNALTNSSTYDMYLADDSASNTIANSAVSSAAQLRLYNSSQNTITNCTFSGGSFVSILYYSNLNNVSGNNISGGSYGVYLSGQASNSTTIELNSIDSCINDGIYVDAAGLNAISGNNVTSCGNAGIRISGASDNSVAGNGVSGSVNYGLSIEGDSHRNGIYNLTGTDVGNSGAGALVQGSGNYLIDISLQGSGTCGMDIREANNASGVTITDYAYGACVHGGFSGGAIYSNFRIENSSSACFNVTNAESITLEGSYIACAGAGISISNNEGSANGALIDNVEVARAGGNAVLITGANSTTVRDSRLHNTGTGILATSSSSLLATGNNITNMSDDGMRVNGGSGNNATNNVFTNTVTFGNGAAIYFRDFSLGALIQGNTVNGTGYDCIVVTEWSTGATVDSNTVSGCPVSVISMDRGAGDCVVSNNNANNSRYGLLLGANGVTNSCNVTGNNVSFVNDSAVGSGIYVYGTGNRIDGNRLTNNVYGMQFWTGNNTADSNYIADNDYGASFSDYDGTDAVSTLSNSTITGSANYDVLCNDSSQDILLNTTFDKQLVLFNGAPDDSELIVKWYVRAYVAMEGAPIEALVNLTSVLGNSTMHESSSGATGLTNYVEFTEYVQNFTTNVTYNNYTAYVNKSVGCGTRFNETQMNLTGSTVWNITLADRNPTITAVEPKPAEDPASCLNTTVNVTRFNVTDLDGACEINVSLAYVNFTMGAITRQSAACYNESGNETSMTINCSGAGMAYWDSPGSWTMNAFVADIYDASANDTSQAMAYNTGIYLTVNNGPMSFGNVGKGTLDNLDVNLPQVSLENCGNVVLNNTIEGVNITDSSGNYSLYVGNFKVGETTDPALATVLAYSSQALQPAGGFNVSSGAPFTWGIHSFVSIPTRQEAAMYNNGTWQLHPGEA